MTLLCTLAALLCALAALVAWLVATDTVLVDLRQDDWMGESNQQ